MREHNPLCNNRKECNSGIAGERKEKNTRLQENTCAGYFGQKQVS
jgi:hypothetical protein